jgi:hypothetical protein
VQARYREISFQTKNPQGADCKDTFVTIVEKARKLGMNAFNYIFDRITRKFEMLSLDSVIEAHGVI